MNKFTKVQISKNRYVVVSDLQLDCTFMVTTHTKPITKWEANQVASYFEYTNAPDDYDGEIHRPAFDYRRKW